MFDLFVYHWSYEGYVVHGHCLDNDGTYQLLTVHGYYPSCYVEGSLGLPACTIVPLKVKYRRMTTSRDISTLRPFYQVFFKNMKDMNAFVYEQSKKRTLCMENIPQINVFLSQIGVDHVGWVRVPSYCVNSPDDVVAIPDRNPYPSPKIMVFDIEVKSKGTGMPQSYRMDDTIEMISVVVYRTGHDAYSKYILHTYDMHLDIDAEYQISYKDETKLIQGFFELISREDPTVITGFNIFGFDIDYIVSRLQLRLLEIPDISRGTSGSIDLISVDWSSDAYGHNKYKRLVIGGRIILDMYLYFKRLKLDKYSLDFVSNKYLGEGKNDMHFAEMMEAFESRCQKSLSKVAQYCIQDSVLVMKLFDKVQMWIDACEISKITGCGIEDIYTRGEQMKMISQCVRECIRRNIVLQYQPTSEWTDYEGAYVLEPKKGVYNNCSILDFQSLYPSIIIAYNVCPSTYTRLTHIPHFTVGKHRFMKEPVGLLPGMIKRVLDERIIVKTAMKSYDKSDITYTVLDRRQNALKVCANSVYGMMGFKNSRYFGHVGCAESVTTVGRELLSDIICKIESLYPVKIVYGDTDSCIVWRPDGSMSKEKMTELGEDICKYVTSKLPPPMALKFESYYDRVILLSKKRYILVNNTPTKILYKGVMNARRDYCKYAKDMYKGIIEMVAIGVNSDSIKDYIDRKIIMLLSGKCDISDMVITKSVARELRSYKVKQPHVVMARRLVEKGKEILPGTRLEFVFVKAPDAAVQADRMRTPEEVAEEGLEIDGKFYIKKQLATQIDDVLSVIGLDNYIKETWK